MKGICCSWKDCEEDATHMERVDMGGGFFGLLCDAHYNLLCEQNESQVDKLKLFYDRKQRENPV